MKIVMPMAGRGSRFAKAGITQPKPLIEVLGKTLVQWSVEGMKITNPGLEDKDFVFVCHADHERDFKIGEKLREIVGPGIAVLFTPVVTEGAACTVLLAKKVIDPDEDMLMCDSDHFVVCPAFRSAREESRKHDWGGIIPTIERDKPHYSYARLDDRGNVVETREKQMISTHAAALYYFTKWKYFVSAAEAMIAKNERHNNEFYMCPVYNHIIAQGRVVRTVPVELAMHLGTPEEMQYFVEHVPMQYRT
ncbi:glycosyl transferase family 2 [Candidatus Parcubacteria bacterium]|nr:MAG: glycosyl transferase family 2 [Candidatus Parcubacteria bacterium]